MAKEHLKSPEAKRGKDTSSKAPRLHNPADILILDFWERTHFYCFNHEVCGTFLGKMQKTNTAQNFQGLSLPDLSPLWGPPEAMDLATRNEALLEAQSPCYEHR